MVVEIVVGATVGLSAVAGWLDLRNRMNGHGPLAKKLDGMGDRMARAEDREARIETRLMSVDSRLLRVETIVCRDDG